MKANPKMAWNADRLDVRAFAQASAHFQVDDPLARFGRLSDEQHGMVDQASVQRVRWRAQGELRPHATGGAPAVWLHLQADTVVALTCQRCLGVVDVPLSVDRWFRFVADEATASAEDDDCDEDVLALEPRPSLYELLEDELLMELPLVPMHDTCPVPVIMQVADPAVVAADGEPERKNPFAELARLKK